MLVQLGLLALNSPACEVMPCAKHKRMSANKSRGAAWLQSPAECCFAWMWRYIARAYPRMTCVSVCLVGLRWARPQAALSRMTDPAWLQDD